MEKTFVMVKPDGVQRNLVGEVIARFEQKGFCIVGLKILRVSRVMAERHYAEHVGKSFYPGLVEFITSGPVVAMVVAGRNAVAGVRKMLGATDPAEAAPGTIRGDLGLDIGRNVVHGSDSAASAERETDIYFTEAELLEYHKTLDAWIHE